MRLEKCHGKDICKNETEIDEFLDNLVMSSGIW